MRRQSAQMGLAVPLHDRPFVKSLQEGHACSGETQKYVNIVSTICTGVCCQLYLDNLQTGIRAEQLEISLFVMFWFFFFFML